MICLSFCCTHSVGVPGFEPGTPCSQSRYASRTALYPEIYIEQISFYLSLLNFQSLLLSDPLPYSLSAERGGFEPPVPFRARMFSKHVVSATHPPLRLKICRLQKRKRIANIAFQISFIQIDQFFCQYFFRLRRSHDFNIF
jgi:hypothetical protein